MRYFEDYVPGVTFDCGLVSMDEAAIIAFGNDYDPQPFHTDPVLARPSPYGGLIASGWHTADLVTRQLVDNYLSRSPLAAPRRPDADADRAEVRCYAEGWALYSTPKIPHCTELPR